MGLIHGKNVKLTYDFSGTNILRGIDFEIEHGETSLFLGPSGSGKSSLAKCIAQLEQRYSGHIYFDNTDLKSLKKSAVVRKIGYVSQTFDLFKNKTILNNCIDPQRIVLKSSYEEAFEKAKSLLIELDVFHLANRFPNEISGGQKQRVAICRALCMDSKVMLMDEPNSALDPQVIQ